MKDSAIFLKFRFSIFGFANLLFFVVALDNPQDSSTLPIFKPFQIACESGNPELSTIAIDCLGKLFTYNYWGRVSEESVLQAKEANGKEKQSESNDADDGDNDGTETMITFVIDTICNGFSGESTDERVQLQIIKVSS